MRGRADRRANLTWWCGAGDVQPPHGYDYTTENLTTTEDATECTDGQIMSPYRAYSVYPTYRVPRTYGPGQYYYPVRRRSRRTVAPFTVPYVSYEAPNPAPRHHISPHRVPPDQVPPHQLPQYQMPPHQLPLKGRRRSRRSLLQGQKRRSGYSLTAAAALSPQQPPLIRRKHKMFVYSGTIPTDVEDGKTHPKVNWRNTKKTSGRGKVISWCREAVESETSNDGKSVHSTYSRLSVDISNEMEAMNRDIETILSRYESTFDQNILQELEERGLGKKKKVKQEVITKTAQSPPQKRSPPPLTEEQKKLLAMEKPPLDRLTDIPIEYLKPLPPTPRIPTLRENPETSTNVMQSNTTDAVWKTMLQDLLHRGVLKNLDDASLTKFQSTLNELNAEDSKVDQKIEESRPVRRGALYRSSEKKDHIHLYSASESKPSWDFDYMTLSSGARIPDLKEGSGLPSPVELEEFSKPVGSTGLPALVERSADFLPVNKVDDHSNWRKTIDEIREVSQAHCDKCKSLADQLNVFRSGGSGDKLFPEEISVNTERTILNSERTSLKEEMARTSSKNFPYGDQNTNSSLPKPVLNPHRKESYSLGDAGRVIPGMKSNITVNTALTGRTRPADSQTSVSTASTTEESLTNPSSTTELKAGIGVAVEDLSNDEDVPLQRKSESIRLGRTTSAAPTPHRRRPNTPTSHASTVIGISENKTSTERRDSDDVDHGCGDSSKAQAENCYQGITSLVDDIRSGKIKSTADLDKNLAELNRSISDNAVLLNTSMCISIIRKLLDIMLASEPVLETDGRVSAFIRLLEFRKHHMQHINSELNHIEQIENDSFIKGLVKAYFLPPSTSTGINQ